MEYEHYDCVASQAELPTRLARFLNEYGDLQRVSHEPVPRDSEFRMSLFRGQCERTLICQLAYKMQ